MRGAMVLKKLFGSSERELLDLLRRHLALSREALSMFTKLLGSPDSLGPEELVKYRSTVIRLEKEGDRIYDTAVMHVLKGALPLPLVADLGVLLDDFDDILDLIYFVNMELTRGIRVGIHRARVVPEVYSLCARMAERALKAIDSLEAILVSVTKNLAKASEEMARVDVIEDEVDEIKNEALEVIYERSKDLDVLTFTHLVEMVRSLDTVVDKIQDSSQELVRIFTAVYS
jgi:uncharacterized protein Yka (UPF0111/DUF47 family)